MNNIENDSLLYTTCPKCARFPKLIITSNKESPLTLICDNCKYTSSFHIPDYISLLSKNHPSLPCKQCSLCKHETPKHFCIECSLTLCNTCTSKHSKSNDSHQLLNTNIQIETTCLKHKDYYVTFYCKQCSLYHCELCNESEHKKHKSINICDIYDTHFTETKIKQYEKLLSKGEYYINEYHRKEKEHIINILRQQITNIEHAYQKYVIYNHNIIQLSKLILSSAKNINYYNLNLINNVMYNLNYALDSINVKRSSLEDANVSKYISYYETNSIIDVKHSLYKEGLNEITKLTLDTKGNNIEEINPITEINYGYNEITSMFLLNDKRLAVASRQYLKVFNLQTGNCDIRMRENIEDVIQLKNGKVVTGQRDKNIKIFKLTSSSLKLENTLSTHLRRVSKLIEIPSLVCFVSSSYDKNIKIWNNNSPYDELYTLSGPHTESIFSMLYLPNKKHLVSAANELIFWDLLTYQLITVIKGINCFNKDALIQINDNSLMIGEKIITTIIDLNTYQIIKQIKQDLFRVTTLTHMYNTLYILAGTKGGSIYLVNASSIKNISTITKSEKLHSQNAISCIIALEDKNTFASVAIGDKFIRIWSIN